MSKSVVIIKVKVSWWVPLYLESLIFFCNTFGLQPDYDKVSDVISKGIKVVR